MSSPTTRSNSPATIPDEPPTRRAMVATAMAGIDRFKRSWISVMVLKSSIGLGQVVALITLLLLANTLDSPLAPHARQTVPSDACPSPHLFQAWIGVNICRLTICWCVSVWMVMRHHRTQARQRTDEEITATPRTPPHIPHSDTMPSLSHSERTASSTTLAAMSSSSHVDRTPPLVYQSNMGSNLSLDALACYNMEGKRPNVPITSADQVERLRDLPSTPSSTTVANDDVLQAARDLHAGRETISTEASQINPLAAWLDRHALTMSKSLGLISAILFILGNILVFYPNPSSQQTCYHASPMLWWGVMVVIAIGWILFGQVFFVMIIVGIGGQAVLAVLRKAGLITPPPEPEPPRAPLPEVLFPADLDKLELVIYLPDPNEPPINADGEEITPVRAPIDPTRLAHRPIYLSTHRATCAICQEVFVAPVDGKTIMLKADPLRLLCCGHVYHRECIDQWLLEGHGNCPFCNKSVRDLWDKSTRSGEKVKERKKSILRR